MRAQVVALIVILCLFACPIADAGVGRLLIDMRAGGSAMDLNINLTGPNGPVQPPVKILPDGRVDVLVEEGHYHGDLADGNGGQSEHQEADVVAGQASYMSFLGHAVATIRYPRHCSCPWDCERVWMEEVNHTVHHEAETETVVVIDQPAYCEWVRLPGHWEYRIGSGGWRWGNCPLRGMDRCVPICEERWIPGELVQRCYPEVSHTETRTTSEAWDEFFVDQPAGWITVCKVGITK
jgi:hypothetical protein